MLGQSGCSSSRWMIPEGFRWSLVWCRRAWMCLTLGRLVKWPFRVQLKGQCCARCGIIQGCRGGRRRRGSRCSMIRFLGGSTGNSSNCRGCDACCVGYEIPVMPGPEGDLCRHRDVEAGDCALCGGGDWVEAECEDRDRGSVGNRGDPVRGRDPGQLNHAARPVPRRAPRRPEAIASSSAR